ncbi:MAG: YbaN family protein [Deinococcales bacterium]
MKLDDNLPRRYLWFILGLFFTCLGFIGAFLPIMPSTVFLLIAAYFFARSSPRFYNWLLNHPVFGQLIRDWRRGLGNSFKS